MSRWPPLLIQWTASHAASARTWGSRLCPPSRTRAR